MQFPATFIVGEVVHINRNRIGGMISIGGRTINFIQNTYIYRIRMGQKYIVDTANIYNEECEPYIHNRYRGHHPTGTRLIPKGYNYVDHGLKDRFGYYIKKFEESGTSTLTVNP